MENIQILIGADDWEDVPDAEAASQRGRASSVTSSRVASTVSSRRKRRVMVKATPAASPPPPRSQPAKPQLKKAIVSKEVAHGAFVDGVRFIASYALDIIKGSIEMMREPLRWVLFLLMFACLASRMTNTLRMAFSPLCIVPGISRSTLCVPAQPPVAVNFTELLNIQSSTFEKLEGESAGSSELSIKVLKAEMAARDLSLLVRFSDFNSKDSIADVLDTIARDAKKTERGLSRLNAKVVGGIDDLVLGELWTKLGGNQKSVREYGDRLELLNDLEEYRKKALAHVTATLRALNWMSDDLEVLRDRVAAPALLEGKVPLHVHIESIKHGLERLREGQTRMRAPRIGDENV
ncbi:hypothetical protein BDN67DRAFT_904097 [Paxillus ammoniavirescens]|nr:hypothetical protein BDN67DRAFT_904097 [Paxillus ammoniavirescens]